MISVAIVDDQRSFRARLQRHIEAAEDLQCTGVYERAAPALQGLREQPAQVVLLSACLPDMPGVDLIQQLKSQFPELLILVVADRAEDTLIYEALRQGALGFLLRSAAPDQFVRAISEVYSGGVPLSKPVARRVAAYFVAEPVPDEQLSDREQMVFRLLCAGKDYREIADALHVSPHTVRFHLKNIYRKLGVKSRHEAVSKAYRMESG